MAVHAKRLRLVASVLGLLVAAAVWAQPPKTPPAKPLAKPSAAKPAGGESLAAQLKTGKWKLVKSQIGDFSLAKEALALMGDVTFGEGKAKVYSQAGKVAAEIAYSVDEKAKPATLTTMGVLSALEPPSDDAQEVVGIFRIAGDKLEICYGGIADEPLTEFKAVDGAVMNVYERAK